MSGVAHKGAVLQMCLEMVMAVALRNRDRLLPIWPHVHEFLAAILAPSQVRHPLCTVTANPIEPCLCPVSSIFMLVLALSLQCVVRLCRSNCWALCNCIEHC